MERDSKKRVREGDEGHNNSSPSSPSSSSSSSSSEREKHAKTKDGPINYGILDLKNDVLEYKDSSSSTSSCCKTSSESHCALGVFDFPWLKDGIISQSEEWINFEDVFSSPVLALDDTPTFTTSSNPGHGISIDDQFSFSAAGRCFYQTHDQSDNQELLLDFPPAKDKLEGPSPRDLNQDDDGLENEGADCIWTFLLNQPLHQQPN
ncbi:unnamed protein product [Prunus armeniaca]|uniref:Uncharacterized protein n=1 Tax=Prunus armeniaca TaxID=36596 RepID=A0A6J5WZT2_PRUAR|nr:unnamed protein product [Prunus armeniaca]